jgi:transposase
METIYFLGIDISKKKFNLALTLDAKNFYEEEAENNAKGIQALFIDLKKRFSFNFSQLIVCMEHTGIYCQPLLDFLVKKEIKVCVEPALRIKQSQGMQRGKNDQVDAKRIASYAFKNYSELTFWKPQRIILQRLKALLATRERLIKVKVQLQVPLNECADFVEKTVRDAILIHCTKPIRSIEQSILKIEEAITNLMGEDQAISNQVKLATSVPGVGKITALHVILATGEFNLIREPKKFACYSGVAPFEHSSGTSLRGRARVSRMANMNMKKLLHLAAMSAIQCCEELRTFYKRKVDQGKNKMSVLNAVRNKLISRIFACIKNNRLYQNKYQHALV